MPRKQSRRALGGLSQGPSPDSTNSFLFSLPIHCRSHQTRSLSLKQEVPVRPGSQNQNPVSPGHYCSPRVGTASRSLRAWVRLRLVSTEFWASDSHQLELGQIWKLLLLASTGLLVMILPMFLKQQNSSLSSPGELSIEAVLGPDPGWLVSQHA